MTTGGFVLGALLSTYLMGSIARPVSQLAAGLVYVALYGAIIGVPVATAQLIALRREALSRRAWVVAGAVGTGGGYALASVVGELLGNAIDPSVPLIVGEGTIEVASGAVLGLAVGVAQWSALQRIRMSASWIAASVIGAGLGYGAASGALEFVGGPILKASLPATFALILGLFVAAAQALALGRSTNSV